MTLSRTARFLIAALLVAAAAFVWVNFFNQDPLSTQADADAPVALAGDPASTTADPDAVSVAGDEPADAAAANDAGAAGDAAAGVSAAEASDGSADAADSEDAVGVAGAASVPASGANAVPPAVIVTDAPTVATRDLVVDVLPFLVTSPPVAGAEADDDAGSGASRPQVTQRSSINPFSPVVVQAP